MELIFSVVQVVICVVLIFLILMHSGKDAGLSGAFGVGSGAGPARRRLAGRAQPEPLDGLLRVAFAVNTILLLKSPGRDAPAAAARWRAHRGCRVKRIACARSAGQTTPFAKRRP